MRHLRSVVAASGVAACAAAADPSCRRRMDEPAMAAVAARLASDLPCQGAAAAQLVKYLDVEFAMNPDATPKVVSVFGEPQWGVRVLPRAVVSGLYSVPTPAVACIDLREVAKDVSSRGLAWAQRHLKERLSAALHRCGGGRHVVIVVEHAEAARGEAVRLLDVFLELFNGKRSHMHWEGRFTSGAGAVFFLLFENALVVPPERTREWRDHLRDWLHYAGSEFTEEAFLGRLNEGIVLQDAECGGAAAHESTCRGIAVRGGSGGGVAGWISGILWERGLAIGLLLLLATTAAAALLAGAGAGRRRKGRNGGWSGSRETPQATAAATTMEVGSTPPVASPGGVGVGGGGPAMLPPPGSPERGPRLSAVTGTSPAANTRQRTRTLPPVETTSTGGGGGGGGPDGAAATRRRSSRKGKG